MTLKTQLALMALFAGMGANPVRIVGEESYEDLTNEYKLIQQKKSKLSRSKRDRVVYKVEYLIKTGKIILE